jgi:hypothetical protein
VAEESVSCEWEEGNEMVCMKMYQDHMKTKKKKKLLAQMDLIRIVQKQAKKCKLVNTKTFNLAAQAGQVWMPVASVNSYYGGLAKIKTIRVILRVIIAIRFVFHYVLVPCMA